MKLFKLIILLVLLLQIDSRSAETLTISNISTLDYPNITADVFISDSNGNIIYKYDKNSFAAKENGVKADILSYKCSVPGVPYILSSVLTIDISSSMKGTGMALARAGAEEWIKLQTANQFECAITTFNHANYINRDFSSDKTKLLASLQSINPDGGTSFNAAFTTDPAGALLIAARGKHKRVVIMISDGESVGNEEVIVQNAKAIGAEIYCVTLQQAAPQILKNITSRTGGLCWDNVDDIEQIRNIYRSILFISKNIEPCKLVFKSESCSERNELDLTLLPAVSSVIKEYTIASGSLPKIAFPGTNVLEFGFIPIPFTLSKQIELNAVNADIDIKDISFVSNRFAIKDWGGTPPPFTLKENSSRTLTIEYTALDSIFEICEFAIIHGNCNPTNFYAIGGIKDTSTNDNVLRIIEPNGGEAYRIGRDTIFSWKGISPNDTLSYEVSYNGTDWIKLSSNCTNYSGKWTTPLLPSDTYKARITTTKNIDDYSKILTINVNTQAVDALAFKPDGSEIVVAAGQNANIYSSANGDLIRNIANDQSGSKELVWSSQYDFIGRAGSTDYLLFWHRTATANIIGFRQDLQILPRLALNPTNNIIAGGAKSGLLYIWDFPDTKAIDTINTGSAEITDITWAPNGSIFAVATADGQVQIYNSDNDSLLSVFKDTTLSVPSVSWSNSGKYLALAYGKTVEIWNYEITTLIRSLNFPNDITKLKFSSNDNVLTIAHSNVLSIYSYITGSITDSFAVNSQITDFDITDDGTRIALGLADSRVLVFNRSDLPFTKNITKTDISDAYWSVKAPNFSIKSINFGEIYLGDVRDSLFEKCIQNLSGIAYDIDSLKIIGNEDIYSFNNLKHYNLADKQQIDLVIRLSATKLGTYTSRIILYSSGYAFETTVTGKVIPPDLVVLNDLVDFGKLPVGDTLKIKKYMVFNNSSQAAIIDSLKNIGPAYSSFSTDNLKNLSIKANDSIQMNIVFMPNESGRLSSSFRLVYDSRESSKQINLFGEGIAPQINIQDTLIIHQLYCASATFTDSVKIINSGNHELKIKSINSDSPFINNLSSLPLSISPADSAYINISAEITHPGVKYSVLYVESNPDYRNSTLDSVVIITIIDSTSLAIIPHSLSFDVPNINETQSKSFNIKNTGSVPLSFTELPQSTLFRITQFQPRIILPDSSGLALVEFKGASMDGFYIDSLLFNDICGTPDYLRLAANVGSGHAQISSLDTCWINQLTCTEKAADTIIYIKNTGVGDLYINSLELSGESSQFFTFSPILNQIVHSNDSIAVTISYLPLSGGTHTVQLIVKSNAVNSISGINMIHLCGVWMNYSYTVFPDSIHFAEIIEGESADAEFDIVNNGTLPITWQTPEISTSDFSLITINPSITLPGNTSVMTVRFNGGKSDSLYSCSLLLLDSCLNQSIVLLTALPHGFAELTLKIADKQARVNEQITMPLYIQQKDELILHNIDSISGVLQFDSQSALYIGNQKVKYSHPNIGEISYIFNFRKLNSDTLATPEFLVMLTDTSKSQFRFSTKEIHGKSQISILELPGELSLLDSLDLIQISDTAGIISISPHPVRKNAKAEFNILEQGVHRIQIYDILGGKVSTLFDDMLEPGIKKLSFSAESIPIGTYFLILKSPSSIYSKKFLILR